MTEILCGLGQYISYFPLVVFIALLLAGLNIPISEDILIITSAILAQSNKELLIPLYIALYAGIVISDHMVYWEGRLINKGVLKIKFIATVLDESKLSSVRNHLNKYGILTYIVCRFIPFGVRNTLFMASGILNMRYRDFILYDTVAATLSSFTMYTLFYHLGAAVEKPVKVVGTILFIVLLFVLSVITSRLFMLWRKKRRERKQSEAGGSAAPLSE